MKTLAIALSKVNSFPFQRLPAVGEAKVSCVSVDEPRENRKRDVRACLLGPISLWLLGQYCFLESWGEGSSKCSAVQSEESESCHVHAPVKSPLGEYSCPPAF